MDQRPPDRGTRQGTGPAASADPVTAAQLRAGVDPVLAGRDPGAMDEAVGAFDGTTQAGDPGFSTSQGAGADLDTDVSEGRASTDADRSRGSLQDEATGGKRAVKATRDPVSAVDSAMGSDVVALLDLPRWTEHLRALPTWREGDRASSMLLRQPPVRVLLTALRQDAEVGSDGAQETVMLLVLSGSASIEWRGEIARIGEGELAVVPAGGGWRVTSESAETLLLSTFWGTPGTGVADVTQEDPR
jgi:hypothetical protein